MSSLLQIEKRRLSHSQSLIQQQKWAEAGVRPSPARVLSAVSSPPLRKAVYNCWLRRSKPDLLMRGPAVPHSRV